MRKDSNLRAGSSPTDRLAGGALWPLGHASGVSSRPVAHLPAQPRAFQVCSVTTLDGREVAIPAGVHLVARSASLGGPWLLQLDAGPVELATSEWLRLWQAELVGDVLEA